MRAAGKNQGEGREAFSGQNSSRPKYVNCFADYNFPWKEPNMPHTNNPLCSDRICS